ncbi:ABC transporter substrate-binding protein [Sciscionella marina]|uniref:ABC transporter substrate-binding protein n=1 Tax=Sciscionella marina TaxID=508770 RepID=UPI00036F564C|nr:extracellular solute-binding protein [Sciscionella marina]
MRFSRTKPRRLALAFTAGLLAALAACSSAVPAKSRVPIRVPGVSAEADKYMNQLYDKAFADGNTRLVLYGPGVSANQKLNDAFTRRFPGIELLQQDQADAQILTKLDTEAESGNRIADVYVGGESPQAAAKPDICTSADVRTVDAGFKVPTDNGGKLTYFALRYFGFVYNTDQVREQDAPKDWHDLLDPKWKGKIAVGDMTVPGGIRYALESLMLPENEQKWGHSYVRRLAAQNLQVSQSEQVVPTDVASGRFPVGIAVYQGYYEDQKKKGAPLGMVFPLKDGGNYMARSALCLIKDAPDAEVAQLYVNWLYSPEGQRALAEKDNSYGWTPAAPGPKGLPPLDKLPRLPFSNPKPEFNKPYFAFINKAFKK